MLTVIVWLCVVAVLIGSLISTYQPVKEVFQVLAAARAGTLQQFQSPQNPDPDKDYLSAAFWIAALAGWVLGLVDGCFTGSFLSLAVIGTSLLGMLGFMLLTASIVRWIYRRQGLPA